MGNVCNAIVEIAHPGNGNISRSLHCVTCQIGFSTCTDLEANLIAKFKQEVLLQVLVLVVQVCILARESVCTELSYIRNWLYMPLPKQDKQHMLAFHLSVRVAAS